MRYQRHHQRSQRNAAQPQVHQRRLARALRQHVQQVHPQQQADADHRARHAKGACRSVQGIAHIHRDQRPKTPHHEHARTQCHDHEQQRRVMHDEARPRAHIGEHLPYAGPLGLRGRRLADTFLQGNRPNKRRTQRKAHRVEQVAAVRPQARHQERRRRRPHDPHDEKSLLQQGIGGAQTVQRHD